MTIKATKLILCMGAAVLVPLSSPARAQDASDAADEPSTANGSEIIVTAQRRAERLQDVPQAVSVLNASELARDGNLQLRDFASKVPGLSLASAGAGFNQISLRGVSAGLDVGQTVRVYLDEVPYGASGNSTFTRSERLALDPALIDIERIEVLRGPQGTLYGASSMGGVIKYVTVAPDLDDFGGSGRFGLSFTERGGTNYLASGSVNVPVVLDKLAVRAAAYQSHDGGFIDNLALNRKDVDRSNVYGGRLDILYKPTGSFSLRVTGFAQNIRRGGVATADFFPNGIPVDTALDQRRPIAEPFRQKFRLISADAELDLDFATLTSVTSYQSVESQNVYDLTLGLGAALASLGGPFSAVGSPEFIKTDKFIQELRLASNQGGFVEWIAGGFYTSEDSVKRASLTLRNLAGTDVPNTLYNSNTPSDYKEYAAFGNVTLNLTGRLSVTGGLRYSHNEQSAEERGSGLLVQPFPPERSKESVFTYLANARYRFSDRATAYVRYATGYRPGGPNFVLRDPVTGEPGAPPTYDADRLKSYEVGFRGETRDRTFAIDAAAYRIDWTDIQAFDARNPFGGLTNAPSARLWGVELAMTAKPVPQFSVSGSFAYQHTRLTQDAPGLGGFEGDPLPNAPSFSGTVGFDYVGTTSSLRPSFGASLRFNDKRRGGFGANPYILPSFTSVDLRAGFEVQSIEIQVYARNLLDSRGQLASAFTFSGINNVSMIQPRTIGVSLGAKF